MVIDGSMHVLLTPNSQLSWKVSKNHFLTDDHIIRSAQGHDLQWRKQVWTMDHTRSSRTGRRATATLLGRPGAGASAAHGERYRNRFPRCETEFLFLVRDDQLGSLSQQIDRSLWCEVYFQPLALYR